MPRFSSKWESHYYLHNQVLYDIAKDDLRLCGVFIESKNVYEYFKIVILQ